MNYTHSKTPNAFKQGRINNRKKGSTLEVVKRQLGDNFGLFSVPLGKGYDSSTGVISKTNRAASIASAVSGGGGGGSSSSNTLQFQLSFAADYDATNDTGWAGSSEAGITFSYDANTYGSTGPHTYSATGVANSSDKFVVAWTDDDTDAMGTQWAGWTLYVEDSGSLNRLGYDGGGGYEMSYVIAGVDLSSDFSGNPWDQTQSYGTPFDLDAATLPDGDPYTYWETAYDGNGNTSGSGNGYPVYFDYASTWGSDGSNFDYSAFQSSRSGSAG